MPQQPIYYLLLVVDFCLEDCIVPSLVEDCDIAAGFYQQLDCAEVPVEGGPV